MSKINTKVIEYLTLVCLGIYLFYQCMLNTAMPIRITSAQYNIFIIAFALLACAKIIKCIQNKDYKNLSLFSMAFFVSLLSYLVGSYKFLLLLALIMISLYSIEYKKILKVYIIVTGLVLCLSLFASSIEISPNYVSTRPGASVIRSAWGICFATELAAVFTYLSIYLFGFNNKYPDWLLLIPAATSFFIAKFICDSRASMISTSILFILILVYYLCKKYKDKINLPEKIINICFMSSFYIFASIIFICIYLYGINNPIGLKISSVLSNRLQLAYSGIKNYGISPFGSYFDLYGIDNQDKYNFIDISYALILIRYGWVYFLMCATLWTYSMKKALSANNYKLAIILLVIAIDSMIQQHLNEINYNILFVMPFVDYRNNKETYSNIKLETIILVSLSLITVGSFFLIYPKFLSYARTYVEINNLCSIYDNRLFGICSLFIIMILIAYFLFISLKNIALNILEHKRVKTINFIPIFLSIILCITFMLNKDCIYNDTYYAYVPILDSESQVINTISLNKQGNLYASVVPKYYKKHFEDVSYSIYYGEDLARENNATIIADINKTYNAFIWNNLKKVKISDYHVIYTNDESVVSALNKIGYEFE